MSSGLKMFYIAVLIFLNIIWGGTYVASKIAMTEFMPITLAFVRFAAASLIMLPFLVTKYRHIRMDKKDLLTCATLGAIGFTLAYIFQNMGVKMTKTMNAAIEISSEPVMMIILAALLLKEKITGKIIGGIALSTIGVLILILPPETASAAAGAGGFSVLGDALVLLSALCCALYTIIGNEAIKRLPSFVVTSYAIITGTIFLFPFAAFYEKGLPAIATASTKSWLCVFYLAAVATSFAYFVWYLLLERLDASFMGNFLNLQPLVGIILGVALLNEPAGSGTFAGAAFIIGGVYITSLNSNKIEEKAVIDPA